MPSVLLADNDRAVSALLTEILARAGVPVAHAYDGETARSTARQPAIKVLVCDLDMPRASGLEVLESLRDLASPPAVVVISGYLDVAVQERLAALPFVREVLRKPFDLLSFSSRVRELAAAQGSDGAIAAASG